MIKQRDWKGLHNRMEDAANSNGAPADKRMYRARFKDGTFNAMGRFLPAPGDEVPFIKEFSHRFKGRTEEYNELCPTTIGKPCPVCDANRPVYDTNDKELIKRVAAPRTRRKSGISNFLVLSDPNAQSNEGKVFLYRYAKTIFEKVIAACFPDEQARKTGAKAIQVFDYITGANFRIVGVMSAMDDGKKFPKYDSSQFLLPPTPLGATPENGMAANEQLIERVDRELFSLKEFDDPSRIKSYDALLTIFNRVMGVSAAPVFQSAAIPVQQPAPTPTPVPLTAPAPAAAVTAPQSAAAPVTEAAPTQPQAATQAAPASAAEEDSTLDFDAVEGQSEDAFWNNIKKGEKQA